MSIRPQGRKIALIGASGTLGKPLVEALLKQNVHTITAIQRADATSTFPAGVTVQKGDLLDEDFLAQAFKGQDTVVLMPPLPQIISIQEPAVRAAAKVGLDYIFPSEFGPDPFATKLIEDNTLLQDKKKIRDLVEKLGVSSWISVAVGPWTEFGIGYGLWGVDAKARKATIWNGADSKVSSSSAKLTSEALAATLGLPEEDFVKLKNKAVYAPSLHFNQRELLAAAQRATGTTEADWTVVERDVKDVRKEYEEALTKGDEMAPHTKFFVTHATENSGGDFHRKIDHELIGKLKQLGLGSETLEDAVKATLN